MLAKGLSVLPGHSMRVISVVIDGESGRHINSLMAPTSSFVHSVWPRLQCGVYRILPCTGEEVTKRKS